MKILISALFVLTTVAAHADDLGIKGCYEAVKTFEQTPPAQRTDEMKITLGWAYLCVANAKVSDVGRTLFSYTESQKNYDVLGRLASLLGNVTEEKLRDIDHAIDSFAQVQDDSHRDTEVIIAKLVKMAALLARQATLNHEKAISKHHISDSSCEAQSACWSIGCDASPTGTMSDDDISRFTDVVDSAYTHVGYGSQNLAGLVQNLREMTLYSKKSTRCFIYKEMIP